MRNRDQLFNFMQPENLPRTMTTTRGNIGTDVGPAGFPPLSNELSEMIMVELESHLEPLPAFGGLLIASMEDLAQSQDMLDER